MYMSKTTFLKILLLFIFIFQASLISNAQNTFRPDAKAYKNADKLLKKMSLDEKIGQLIQIGINGRYLNQDDPEFQRLKKQITQNKVESKVENKKEFISIINCSKSIS